MSLANNFLCHSARGQIKQNARDVQPVHISLFINDHLVMIMIISICDQICKRDLLIFKISEVAT